MNARSCTREEVQATTLRSMGNTAHKLRATLPDLADRTHGQLLELFNETTAERTFLAALQLHQVYSVLMRLGAALEREGRQEAA